MSIATIRTAFAETLAEAGTVLNATMRQDEADRSKAILAFRISTLTGSEATVESEVYPNETEVEAAHRIAQTYRSSLS